MITNIGARQTFIPFSSTLTPAHPADLLAAWPTTAVIAFTGESASSDTLFCGTANDVVPILVHHPRATFLTADATTTYTLQRYCELGAHVTLPATFEHIIGSHRFEEIDLHCVDVEWPETGLVIAVTGDGRISVCPTWDQCLALVREDEFMTFWTPAESEP